MARYECSVCGYIYDEDQEGIRWEALPDDWVCPQCGSDKSLFNRMEDESATAGQDVSVPAKPDVQAALTVARPDVQAAPVAKNTSVEPTLEFIHALARGGLDKTGHHGPMGAMGVSRSTLPEWNNISVPTIPALARARRCLDQRGRSDVTLIITGGLRTPADFIKALCLGANGIAIANAALQAVGCVAARICHTNDCPSDIATQQVHLRARLNIEESSARLARLLTASVDLMKVMARACGHTHLTQFNQSDITTWKREMAELTGIMYAGIGWSPSETGDSIESCAANALCQRQLACRCPEPQGRTSRPWHPGDHWQHRRQ
jgi:rubredoxin